MFFRHTAVLWEFVDLLAGSHSSPLLRHVNPGFDDRTQEIVCLLELANSEADGTVICHLEMGAEGIFIPTEPASPGEDMNGDPLPYVGPGPHFGAIPLFPNTGDGGDGPPGGGLFTFTFALPLIRVQLQVGDGALPNKASGRLILVSNGPVALRPEAP